MRRALRRWWQRSWQAATMVALKLSPMAMADSLLRVSQLLSHLPLVVSLLTNPPSGALPIGPNPPNC